MKCITVRTAGILVRCQTAKGADFRRIGQKTRGDAMEPDFEKPCSICCHETRNAMVAVVYFAKLVRDSRPDIDASLLDSAIDRLNGSINRCASLNLEGK